MKCRPHLLVFKDPSEPRDLIRRLKKRVITVKGRVLSLHDILDLTHCFGSYIPNALEVLWNTHPIAIAIRNAKLESIDNYLLTAGDDGMISFDESVRQLWQEGKITREVAEHNVRDVAYLNRL